MVRFALILVLLVLLLPACGCFLLTDQRHNRGHWQIVKKDLRIIHQDLDIFLALYDESHLDITGR